MMNVDRPARPFTGAFIDWFAAMADLHTIMVIAPHADLDAVDFKFNIGGGALQGCSHPCGISIAAMTDGECWDCLMRTSCLN
ncbi:hypothetical protein [Sphingobium sp. MK2]|uniref:hypothetical protein n=1 Tax=Sphingobium sp. MK2 TaxID=3116540 RepID=UPI0032E359CE